mmetsp:Transcript_9453/g.19960  ORF Transcript_9453/g.19960 Transcript_9453/m.19960 type:complete len:564 (+) Transcript_9453:71-1762(+)
MSQFTQSRRECETTEQDSYISNALSEVTIVPKAGIAWLQGLEVTFGTRYLIMLATAQWFVKGFMWAFVHTSVEWVYRDMGVPGPQMQIYRAVAWLPWSMKPVFGVLSDMVPIMGYRKTPYILAVSVAASAALAHLWSTETSIWATTMCLFVTQMQIAVCDLLTEATYAERMRQQPDQGPNLVLFVWAGINFGSLMATSTVGSILSYGGPRLLYLFALPFSLSVIVPTAANFMNEQPMDDHAIKVVRDRMFLQKEVLVLVGLVGASTVCLVLAGLLGVSVYASGILGVFLGLVVLAALITLFRPEIGMATAFFVIQTCMTVSIDGASFYFFTDDAKAFPDGPHFSAWFYTSGTGIIAGIFNFVGMLLYNKFAKSWRYHSLIFTANIVWCVCNACAALVYTRYNLSVGIPDRTFVITSTLLRSIVDQWLWIPAVVLMSQMCPRGMEATMFALVAGCHNLGSTVASYLGAMVIEFIGADASGVAGDGPKFQYLWAAALLQALAPMLTVALLPYLVPNASQMEPLLSSHLDSATVGSLWHRWNGVKEPEEAEDRDEEEYGTFSGIGE